ncbi:hypothetical protein JCM11251_006634 [Rhodosporidiobolus azoricus]
MTHDGAPSLGDPVPPSSLPSSAPPNEPATELPTSHSNAPPIPPLPPVMRGRPRSTSISSGSPGPAPGTPLPSLFPAPPSSPSIIPPSPQSKSTYPSLHFNPPWEVSSSSSSFPSSSTLFSGHRPSLSVPGIVAPSPLVPGATLPRAGGRHRRTQSVSPPGFPVLSGETVSGFAVPSVPLSLPRRGSGGDGGALGLGKRERESSGGEVGGGVLGGLGKLVIPSDAARVSDVERARSTSPIEPGGGAKGGVYQHTRRGSSPLPHSPTRGRVRQVSAGSSLGRETVEHTQQVLDELHRSQATHTHSPHSSHHHPSSSATSASSPHSNSPHAHHQASHTALLRGVRSHALPHSPTLDATHPSSSSFTSAGLDSVSPLSTSPSSPSSSSGFASISRSNRRLSGGAAAHDRFLRPAGYGSSSPPFGPSSPAHAPHHHPSPLALELGLEGALSPENEAGEDELMLPPTTCPAAQVALSQAMSEGLSLPPLPPMIPRRGSMNSPPLLPISLPPEAATLSPPTGPLIPGTGGRGRSGSITRTAAATSATPSPASLYLEHPEPVAGLPRSPSSVAGAGGTTTSARPLSPPPDALPPSLFGGADAMYPTSGTLPPPASSALDMAARSPPRSPLLFLSSDGEVEMGSSPPFGSTSTFVHPLAISSSHASPPAPPTIPLPLPTSPSRLPLRPSPAHSPSGLSSTRPLSPASSTVSLPPSSAAGGEGEYFPPPSSPRGSPVSLPPQPLPLEGVPSVSSIPPHLSPTGARLARSRSASRSPSRSRSRSRSNEREEVSDGDAQAGGKISPPSSIHLPARSAIPADLVKNLPRVHSPLASPAVRAEEETEGETEGEEEEKVEEQEDEPVEPQQEAEGLLTPPQVHSPCLGLGGLEEPAFPSPFSAIAEEGAPPTPPAVPSPPSSRIATLGPPPRPPQLVTSASAGSPTSPIGTPEHLETSISPTSSASSYFSLPSGTCISAPLPPPSSSSPTGVSRASAVPPLERAPSWEDEFDEDEDFFADDDGSGEVGFTPQRRRSSGGQGGSGDERVSLLEELGISRGTSGEVMPGVSLPPDAAATVSVPAVADDAGVSGAAGGGSFGAFGFMEVDLEAGGGAGEGIMSGDEGEGEDDGMLAIDEESLSMLERIFVCAKSEAVEDRARVAHFLPDWLPGVEICEAVEYVLPLLAGLIEDESVKEVFAPKLDRVMWHFFSNCPLAELDPSSEDGDAGEKPSLSAHSPEPSRPSFTSAEPSPTSAQFPIAHSDESGSPPPTSKTSPSGSTVPLPEIPRISATTFTSLLGALLTDQSSFVAKATESALVRFLCRLRDKPLPPSPAPEEPIVAEYAFDSEAGVQDANKGLEHKYDLNDEAKQLLEDEVVVGIVLGLARLDEDDKDSAVGDRGETADMAALPPLDPAAGPEKAQGVNLHPPLACVSQEESESPTLFLSPEEEVLSDEWIAGLNGIVEQERSAGPAAESWGNPLLPPEGDTDGDAHESTEARVHEQQANGGDHLQPGDLLQSMSSPLGEPIYSTFSPDQPADGDEEASIGKMVSMSLIGAISSAGCLDQSILVEQLLPEVERMKEEPMFYVRKEAVQALGNLAKALSVEVLESAALPLYNDFSRDSLWHVRRAAVLALPSIFKHLPRSALRDQAINAITHFSGDDNRNVRSGALEICGELVYLFHEDPAGVPEEVLSFFLGQTNEKDEQRTSKPALSPSLAFSPLEGALESPPSAAFLDHPATWSPVRPWPTNRDPDREILTAFNLPAVVLTLGRRNWHILRDHHRTLCQDRVEKVRQSLASSLFEVAKIIGAEQSDQSLLEPLGWFLHDVDNIQAAILENFPSLLRSLSPEGGRQALSQLNEAWSKIRLWRQREFAAKEMVTVGITFVENGGVDAVLGVLVRAFKDPVAAVREEAVKAASFSLFALPCVMLTYFPSQIPPLLEASLPHSDARNKLAAFLHVFSTDSSYRNRSIYVACALACVRANIPRQVFEEMFLGTLSELARDKVVSVRIAVARAVGEACRTETLYAHPSTRYDIDELLSTLAQSPDRDVHEPVAEFFAAPPPSSQPTSPRSPPPHRSGVHSRMDMYDDDERTPISPTSVPPSAPSLATFSPESEVDRDMADDFPSPFESSASPSRAAAVPLPSPDADDIEMAWEEALETREAEGGDFVEVSRG